VYKSPRSGLTYQFTTVPRNFLEADDFCIVNFGAHLVSYHSREEQQEVEGYYIGIGEAGAALPVIALLGPRLGAGAGVFAADTDGRADIMLQGL
jgi:hypothetical protein